MNNWDDIRFFLAVARTGSVSSAAKQLNVNHSTVSRRLRSLEEKHGVRLFERTNDGYEMTGAADSIYELAVELEVRNQQVSRMLLGQDTQLRGRVDLTIPHDIFEFCLSDDLANFLKLHPEIDLNLLVAKGLKNLANREADLAVRLSPSPPDYLIGHKIAQMRHGIYCSSGQQKDDVVNIIAWSDEPQIPDWAKEHFPEAKVSLRVDDLHSMYAAVKAGFGVARMPCYVADAINDCAVLRLPIELPFTHWYLWVLSHVDLRKTARIQRCKQTLIEALQHRKELFEGQCSNYVEAPGNESGF